jgi:hypothetical protein
MYELNAKQTQSVAGGNLVYVTEEWKRQSAIYSGVAMGVMGAIIGGGLMASASVPAAAMLTGSALGGLIGYGAGYGLSVLENIGLENNTWYDFSYTYIVVYY